MVLVSDTWAEALDRREFTGERLRWRGDIHASDNLAECTTGLPPELANIVGTIIADNSTERPYVPPAMHSESPVQPMVPTAPPVSVMMRHGNSSRSSTIAGAFPGQENSLDDSDSFSDSKDDTDEIPSSPIPQDMQGMPVVQIVESSPRGHWEHVPHVSPLGNPKNEGSYNQGMRDQLQPLIDVLDSERNNDRLPASHRRLDRLLKEANTGVYDLAGVQGIREYLEMAKMRNIVSFADGDWDTNNIWVALRSADA